MAEYFIHFFDDMGLCEVAPLKLEPTWRILGQEMKESWKDWTNFWCLKG